MNDLFATQDDLSTESSGAHFGADPRYRYTLWRRWGDAPAANFIMLNPSTATEVVNDPTITRCVARAKRWGYGQLTVTNLFALRATDPRVMLAADDPVGPENDVAILEAARAAGLVVCAWGNHGTHRGRARQVVALLRGVPLYYLKLAKTGEPMHPLYLGYDLEPTLWETI